MLKAGAIALLVVAGCSSERAPSKPSKPDKPAPSKGSPFETFTTTTPAPGEAAPAFELADTDGVKVKLSDATARGPVVVVFGSFT